MYGHQFVLYHSCDIQSNLYAVAAAPHHSCCTLALLPPPAPGPEALRSSPKQHDDTERCADIVKGASQPLRKPLLLLLLGVLCQDFQRLPCLDAERVAGWRHAADADKSRNSGKLHLFTRILLRVAVRQRDGWSSMVPSGCRGWALVCTIFSLDPPPWPLAC